MADEILTPLPGADPEFCRWFIKRIAVSQGDACWLWRGSRTKGGYGTFKRPSKGPAAGKRRYAHRAAYALFRGELTSLYVLHSCDNPSCVRPSHLRLGTQQENMDDRGRRGRTWNGHGPRKNQVLFFSAAPAGENDQGEGGTT